MTHVDKEINAYLLMVPEAGKRLSYRCPSVLSPTQWMWLVSLPVIASLSASQIPGGKKIGIKALICARSMPMVNPKLTAQ